MADSVFNIAKGRVAELYNRVKSNDPANAAIVIVALVSTATHATLRDLDTLSAVLGDANTAEATNTNYARKVLTDADIDALAVDDANDRMPLDLADQTFSAIAAGSNWTHILICYDSDTTGGTDANIVPLTLHDFAVTPDGSDIVVQIADFYRAA